MFSNIARDFDYFFEDDDAEDEEVSATDPAAKTPGTSPSPADLEKQGGLSTQEAFGGGLEPSAGEGLPTEDELAKMEEELEAEEKDLEEEEEDEEEKKKKPKISLGANFGGGRGGVKARRPGGQLIQIGGQGSATSAFANFLAAMGRLRV